MRGFGTVYKQAGSRYWWIQYWRDGRRFRESSGQEKFREAQKVLKTKILGEAPSPTAEDGDGGFTALPALGASRAGTPRGPTVSDLYQGIERNYTLNKRKSLDDLQSLWKNHLSPALGGMLAASIDSDRIETYAVARQAEGAANGSINRELSALKRMFRLAKKGKKVKEVPWIETLKEAPPRSGFVADQIYAAIARETGAIGGWLRAIMEIGYNHGWRKNELLKRRVRHFDSVQRRLCLDPGEAKNDEPRWIPLTGLEFELLRQCCLGKPVEEYIFTRERAGKNVRVSDFRDDWSHACCAAGLSHMTCRCGGAVTEQAQAPTVRPARPGVASTHRMGQANAEAGERGCSLCGAKIRVDNKLGICWSCQLAPRSVDKAGPHDRVSRYHCAVCGQDALWGDLTYHGLLFHDLRRTASRNLIRAGLSEKQAMAHTGHLTSSTFKRYHIVDEKQMQESLVKIENAASDRQRESHQRDLFRTMTEDKEVGQSVPKLDPDNGHRTAIDDPSGKPN